MKSSDTVPEGAGRLLNHDVMMDRAQVMDDDITKCHSKYNTHCITPLKPVHESFWLVFYLKRFFKVPLTLGIPELF